MTAFVIDAASVLSWCFEDEDGALSDALIERVAAEGAVVPGSWSLDLANGLVMAERRNRISRADSMAFIAMIEELPIVMDGATGARALRDIAGLAREYGLTAYDAAYLELAMRLRLPLVTSDPQLDDAASRAGVAVLGGDGPAS